MDEISTIIKHYQTMNHDDMDHSMMDHGNMDHNDMDQSAMDHSMMDHHSSTGHHHDHFKMDKHLSSESLDKFCNGNMAMNMDGFVLNLKGGKDTTCINYLLPSMTLDTRTKFVIAMIITVFFGILLEYISKVRISYQKRFYYNKSTGHGNNNNIGKCKIFILHLLQSALGYVGMMIAMTYSIELLSSIVFGLGLGYAYFFKVGNGNGNSSGNSASNNGNYSEGLSTSNPCCTFVNEDVVNFDNNQN